MMWSGALSAATLIAREADILDDGPQKPVHIWSRTGRGPLLAAGNSNGDIPMLEFTRHQGSGAEQARQRADRDGWRILSIKNDSATVVASAG